MTLSHQSYAHTFLLRVEEFSWTNEEGDLSITFHVTELLFAISQGKVQVEPVRTPLDTTFAERWLSQRSLSYATIATLSRQRMDEPVLGVGMPDGTVLLIDGSHRYMARHLKGLPTVDYNIVWQPSTWLPYATITKGTLL
jgi:hypothetical protein